MNISKKEMRMLEIERQMEAGEQSYVIVTGSGRWAFSKELLKENGIHNKQTISQSRVLELVKQKIADLMSRIAIKKATDETRKIH